jgi:hypothetical protein
MRGQKLLFQLNKKKTATDFAIFIRDFTEASFNLRRETKTLQQTERARNILK